jgi:hypothetical protein
VYSKVCIMVLTSPTKRQALQRQAAAAARGVGPVGHPLHDSTTSGRASDDGTDAKAAATAVAKERAPLISRRALSALAIGAGALLVTVVIVVPVVMVTQRRAGRSRTLSQPISVAYCETLPEIGRRSCLAYHDTPAKFEAATDWRRADLASCACALVHMPARARTHTHTHTITRTHTHVQTHTLLLGHHRRD